MAGKIEYSFHASAGYILIVDTASYIGPRTAIIIHIIMPPSIIVSIGIIAGSSLSMDSFTSLF
jgi:hypothetical protein